MKRIIAGIFVGIMLWTLGCSINKGEGVFNVEAEITQFGNTLISVKYNIGETVVFDDITMKDNLGLMNMIKKRHTLSKKMPLGIHIEFHESDESQNNMASLKYYYGANLLSESKSFDLDALLRVAKANPDIFTWQYKDGNSVSTSTKNKKEKEMKEKSTPSISPPAKEVSDKL